MIMDGFEFFGGGGGVNFTQIILAILAVFYASALVKGTPIKKAMLFWLGIAAMFVAIVAMFFVCSPTAGKGLNIATNVIQIIMAMISFPCFVIAFYAGQLPFVEGMKKNDTPKM